MSTYHVNNFNLKVSTCDLLTFFKGHGALKLHSPGLLQQPWFIGTLIAAVGAAMFFLLSLFCCYIYKRNRRQDKLTKNGTVSGMIVEALIALVG